MGQILHGKLHLFVAIDRTFKLVMANLYERATVWDRYAFLPRGRGEVMPRQINLHRICIDIMETDNQQPTVSTSGRESSTNMLPKDILECYSKQKANGDWTFYNEREFMENLFCTRLNYFFVIFSLILMAAVTVRSNANLILVLIIGAIIQLLLWFSVYRIYIKLDIVLKILHNLDDYHVFSVTDNLLRERKHFSFKVIPLLGIWLPLVCVVIWCVGLILALSGCILLE